MPRFTRTNWTPWKISILQFLGLKCHRATLKGWEESGDGARIIVHKFHDIVLLWVLVAVMQLLL